MVRRAILLALVLACAIFVRPGPAAEKPEFRAMWVSIYGPGLLTPQEIDDTISAAKAANLNALFLQVRKTGDAYYKSDYEPRGENLDDPNFDPLAYMVKKAHENKLEIHAWMNTYKVWQGWEPPVSPQHAFNKHPDWVNMNFYGQYDKSGQWGLDPGIPEVQEYLFNIYMDVVKKYDVDGIHFDYVRYWSPDFGYTPIAVARFNKETGRTGTPAMDDPVWCQWRRDRVTDLVRQVYEGAKKIKPWVKVTGSVVASQDCPLDWTKSHPYNDLLQDWERWLREGIIDAVVPMNYKSESDPVQARQFRDWIDGAVRWKHGRHVYNGITVGSIDDFVTQVQETRKRGGDGVVGFDFGPRRNRTAYADDLTKRVFQTWVPTPRMPWKPARPDSAAQKPASDAKALFDQAVSASRGKDLDGAIELMRKAVDADPDYAEAHFRLGGLYLRKGMRDDAAAEFRQTLEINPSHGGALVELGRMQGGIEKS